MNNRTKLTLIRHAESQLNIASHRVRQQFNLPYVWQLLCQHKQFLSGVKYNPDFLDCDITQKGVQQCITARQHANDIQLDLILVSPLFRTLRTCNLVFQNHKNVPVIVQPLLAQAFRSSCDIPSSTQEKIKKFPNYNFEQVLNQGQFWFLKNQSLQNQQKYYQLLEKYSDKTYSQKMHIILQFMSDTLIYQHSQNMRARAYRIKQMIKQKYSEKYKNIGIVAHYNTINYLMATKFKENSQPEDCLDICNCQIVQNQLQQMLKHR